MISRKHVLSTVAATIFFACSTSPPEQRPAATPTPVAAKPQASKDVGAPAPMSLAASGIVPDWLDRSADPCKDFFAYACGGFLKTAQIPPDRVSWGSIQIVVKSNEDFLHGILEKAARDAGSDPVQKKVGDYYAACMDEDAIEKAATAPLDPFMAVIAKVKDARTAAAAVIDPQALGVTPFFALGPSQDFADATQVITAFDQAGLGLPDRDYYLKDVGNMKDIRTAYRAHIGRMFALLGKKPAEAQAAVADVFRIETALA